jgi:hypothetical protein
MIIVGEWYRCDDDEVRPIIRAKAVAANGVPLEVEFLIDTGADLTTFSAPVLEQLALPHLLPRVRLRGVGGEALNVDVETTLYLPTDSGGAGSVVGSYAAFLDPFALDMSVIGRDILDHFAVIVDRPGNRVCLLGQNHSYRIVEAGGL